MKENEAAIYIIVPVYNEASTIRSVICSLQKEHFLNIIVIDDGSTENIFSEICDLQIHYLRHAVNLGQGAALQTGFFYALQQHAAIVVTFDADGQHDPADVKTLITPIIAKKADVVLGSRFLQEKKLHVPFSRKVILQTARFINFCFSSLLLTDAHNGLRALNSIALQKITLEQNRMAHASELIFAIRKNKLRVLEVPVTIRYTTYTLKKGQRNRDSIAILFDLLLLKFFK